MNERLNGELGVSDASPHSTARHRNSADVLTPVITAYYILTNRETTYPPSWRWQIVRRGRPMGVTIDGRGYHSYEAARFAGRLALEDFLTQLRQELHRDEE